MLVDDPASRRRQCRPGRPRPPLYHTEHQLSQQQQQHITSCDSGGSGWCLEPRPAESSLSGRRMIENDQSAAASEQITPKHRHLHPLTPSSSSSSSTTIIPTTLTPHLTWQIIVITTNAAAAVSGAIIITPTTTTTTTADTVEVDQLDGDGPAASSTSPTSSYLFSTSSSPSAPSAAAAAAVTRWLR
ncbi:hypothetical protein TYRP_013896 [Tyrophagus putrescentiae]|nr:hypothetical protein TYRP_013896 [Tyrophagus putrescentiae]